VLPTSYKPERVGAVVLNYGTASNSLACAFSLAAIKVVDQIVIVDNASPSGDASWLAEELAKDANRSAATRITLQALGANLGYSGGNNHGIDSLLESGATHVVVINPDVEIGADCLEAMMGHLAHNVSVVSPILCRHEAQGVVDTVGGLWNIRFGRGELCASGLPVDEVRKTAIAAQRSRARLRTFAGACFIVRAEDLRKIGGLPDELFLYGEEAHLTMKMKSRGLTFEIAMDAVAYHARGGSIGSAKSWVSRSEGAVRYGTESALLLTRAWWPAYLPLVLAGRLGMLMGLILMGRVKLARGVFLGLIGGLLAKPPSAA
jgi:GT2 family glycosyltransferase